MQRIKCKYFCASNSRPDVNHTLNKADQSYDLNSEDITLRNERRPLSTVFTNFLEPDNSKTLIVSFYMSETLI